MAVKLVCMRGFSGAGKTTRARKIAESSGGVVVCRDDLRNMLHGTYWSGKKQLEDQVTIAEEDLVSAYLRAGVSTCVDATHLNPPYLRKWAKLATRMGVEFEVVDIRNDVDWCISADLGRQCNGERHVGPKVIHEQARRWPMHKWPTITAQPFVIEPVEWIDGLPECILCDIDGTLARSTGRSPYDYTRVHEDAVESEIKKLVNLYFAEVDDVIIMSGRDHTCFSETHEWLVDNGIWFDDLIMRPADAVDNHGNKAPDYQVKLALFNEHIRGKWNVRVVIDDRLQVCEMWHRLGLKLLRVGDPNSDF